MNKDACTGISSWRAFFGFMQVTSLEYSCSSLGLQILRLGQHWSASYSSGNIFLVMRTVVMQQAHQPVWHGFIILMERSCLYADLVRHLLDH